MTRIRELEFKVYLEGVLLPAKPIGSVIRVAPNAPKMISLSLPPFTLKLAEALLPRTHCLIFWREGPRDDQSEASWKLWCEAEYTGMRYLKSGDGNFTLVLDLQGMENYWQYTYAINFQSAKSLSATNLHDSKVIMGTTGNIKTIEMPGGANPVPLQTEIGALFGKDPDQITFPEVFVDLFKGVKDLNAFFRAATERLRLEDRFSFVADAEVAKLTTAQNIRRLTEDTFTQHPRGASLIEIMSALMANAHYGYQSVPFPPYLGDHLGEFMIKPSVPFVAPPRCNVIFPGQIQSMKYGRQLLAEPTRARFSLPVGVDSNDQNTRRHYYAPEQMERIVELVKDSESELNVENLLLTEAQDGVDAESREDIKGVIPMVSNFPSFEALTLADTEVERDEYFAGLTNYQLQLAQHAPRTLTVRGPLNPYVVCGFPALVVADHGVFIGNVVSVTHQAYAGAAPTTSIEMSHARQGDITDLQEPIWKNDRYTDMKRLDDTYGELLGGGMTSILAATAQFGAALSARSKSQVAAAERIRRAHQDSQDAAGFERGYSERPIATFLDVLSFLKAQRVGRDLTGATFRSAHAAPARALATALTSVVQDGR